MPPAVAGGKPYLRLRGGRNINYTGANGSNVVQFHEFRKVSQAGAIYDIALHYDGSATKWKLFNTGSLTDILTVTGAPQTRSAIASVRSKCFMYNGKGSRSTNSLPAFSSWDGTTVRYVGLDAFCPSGSTPVASFTAGSGHNTITDFVSIYVALFNSTTQHTSNGVYAGTLSTPGTGTISVSALDNLVPAYNNSTEQGELYYVFFATIDGGQTAYQILNTALTAPYMVAIGSTTTNLSLSTLVPQGFVLDLTQERPIENYPPRPMSIIAYANGRVYGVLGGGGTGSAVVLPDSGGNYYKDFTYTETLNEIGAVCWSAGADDSTQNDFVGVPEESWPIRNRKFTPNAETPTILDSAPGGNQVLVVTANGTFLLYEAADGLHQWVTVSDHDGAANMNSYVPTPRGPMWLTQKQQLVLLDATTFELKKLSEGFDELLSSPLSYGPTGACADYLWDPHSLIDYYEVWRADGSSVVYDFALGGMAYEKSGPLVTAAKTMFTSSGLRGHFMAGQHIYTQEADPITKLIYTRDQLSSGVFTEINGDYITQWMCFGEPRDRKKFTDMDVTGDGATSAELGASPITFSYYVDLTNAATSVALTKSNQSTTDDNYKARFRTGNFFWLKLRIQLAGHGGDGVQFQTYPEAASYDGELVPSAFGTIFEIAPTENLSGNRP